jgi:acetolactate synthase-1/2/3 large subunit
VLFGGKAIGGMVRPDSQPLLYATSPYLPQARLGADPALLARAAAALAAAERPVIVAGNGVRIADAYTQLQSLAEAAGLPVVTTASGKGCFAETHPLALGVFGTFGTAAANACVADADVVVIIGSKLSPSDTARETAELLNPARQTLVQIDVEPRNASWSYPAEHVLIADAAVVLEQLAGALRRLGRASGADIGVERVKKYRTEHGYFFTRRDDAKPTTPMSPRHAIDQLQKSLPDNAIVTCDAGENRIFMTHFYQTKRAGGFLQAAGAGPMGYAIPSALGAKLVHPERPVVAVCGDGGFSMTMNGLMTAVENDIPIITIILNNQLLGWSAHLRSSFGCELKSFDYAGIARSIGCLGLDVREPSQFAGALEEALAARTTSVINVMVSTDIIFDDVVSPLAKAQGTARPRR